MRLKLAIEFETQIVIEFETLEVIEFDALNIVSFEFETEVRGYRVGSLGYRV